MADDKDSSNEEDTKGKRLVITASISVDDARRIQQAFDEGKLKQFGLTEVSFSPIENSDAKTESWAKGERRKKSKPRDDKTPPRP
jgi:hypothetical protein